MKRTRNSNCSSPASGTGMNDLYKVCLTFPHSAVYFMSRFWCVSSGYYVSVVTHVCVRTRMHRGSYFHQRCRILKSSKLHKGLEPALAFPSSLYLQFPRVADTQQNASPPLFVLLSSPYPSHPHAVHLSTCSGARSASG